VQAGTSGDLARIRQSTPGTSTVLLDTTDYSLNFIGHRGNTTHSYYEARESTPGRSTDSDDEHMSDEEFDALTDQRTFAGRLASEAGSNPRCSGSFILDALDEDELMPPDNVMDNDGRQLDEHYKKVLSLHNDSK
jgi:hypothetical protein